MFEPFNTLFLAAHLMCVNIAAGGPLIATILDWRGLRGSAASASAALYLARVSLGGLLAGAALGLVIGWLKWDEQYAALWLGPLNYKLKGAVIEAVFSLGLMLVWWLWMPGKSGGRIWPVVVRGVIALLAASNLLYHFPLLFTVAAHLHAEGETAGEVLSGADFRRQLNSEAFALMIHVTLASLAVAGTMLLGLALRWLRQGNAENAFAIGRTGARWALVASLLQFPVGLWTLMALRPAVQAQLMGETASGVLFLLGAIAAALWLVNELAHLCFGEFSRPLAIRAMAAMLLTIVLMTAMQQHVRGL